MKPLLAAALGALLIPWITSAQSVVTECTQTDLETKIFAARTNGGNGVVTFDCDGLLRITNTVTLRRYPSVTNGMANDITLDVTGHSITFSGPTTTNNLTNISRLFLIESGVKLTVIDASFANARATNGAVFWVSSNATLHASGCFFSNNIAIGSNGLNGASASTNNVSNGTGRGGASGGHGGSAAGGVIYNLGEVRLLQSSFVTNGVIGGDGGNGGNAGNGTVRGGNAGNGGRGGSAVGGAIFNAGILTTTNCSFHANFALGGFGGNGGNAGAGIFAGLYGRGGAGGGASGGAIHNQRNGLVTNFNTTFAFNVTDGGDSANGGSNSGSGKGGASGAQASGGGIANHGVQELFNCTFFSNGANGGNGGTGSDGTVRGGTGGYGGSAWGGNIFSGRKSILTATHCTIADGGAVGGTNGAAGNGALPGKAGKAGASRGANLSSSNGIITLRNTIVSDPVTGTNAYGKKYVLQGRNISSDLSFKTYAKLYKAAITNLNPRLEALARNGGDVSTMRLLEDSPAINFATNNFGIASDARGIRRPYPLNGLPDVGAYEHGTYLTAPFIVTHPQDTTALRSNTVIFTVVAQGDPPLLYSWRKNSVAITNATSSTLVLTRVTDADQANYDVLVSNNSGTVESDDAELTVVIPAFITRQPTNLFVSPGGTAVFAVTAEGDGTLSYQWRSNGVAVLGANRPTLTITNVQPSFAAAYSVRVQNQYGTATSSNAFLVVTSTPPTIVTQPTNTAVLAGRTATFTMEATGTLPLDFLFLRDGTNALNPISSYTGSATFSIPNAQPADAGSYQIVVTNYGGSTNGNVITLQVNVVAPLITQEPVDQTIAVGESATFNVGVLASAPVLYQWFSNGVAVANATNTSLTLTNLGTNASGSFSLFASNSAGFTNSRAAALIVETNLPPEIFIQPASTFVVLGADVTLSVTTSGSRPFTYQWLFDGGVLTNQTNVTLVLNNLVATNFGAYTVEVSNDFGTDISEPAILTRLHAFDLECGNNTCEITITNPEDDLYYTLQVWDNNAKEWLGILDSQLKVEDEALDPFTYTPVPFTNDEDNYRVVVTQDDPGGAPGITIDPEPTSVLLGQDATFTVDGSATIDPVSYRWFFQGTNLVAGQFGPTLIISNAQPEQAGPYNAVLYGIGGAVTSEVATLTVQFEPVTIVTEPTDLTVYGTQTATFSVAATGSTPISYQWFVNGTTPVSGANAATLTLSNVQSADAGSYHVVVSNYFGAVASAAATLTVLDASIVISSQPVSVGVYSGFNATFSVTNTGLAPLTYQWYFNTTNLISGATSRVLSLTNVQSANDGTYQVVITNATGAVTSSPATLSVTNSAPIITIQPPDLQVPAGTEITLSVGVVGSIPMTFQWYHTPIDEFGNPTSGPVAITGGTNAAILLSIPDAGSEAFWEGLYSVAITNAFGGTISADGTVNVEGFGVPP